MTDEAHPSPTDEPATDPAASQASEFERTARRLEDSQRSLTALLKKAREIVQEMKEVLNKKSLWA
jgi:hypothetical protein